MRKGLILSLVMLLCLSSLSGCFFSGRNIVYINISDIKNSLKNDYMITIEEEYGTFNLYGNNANISDYSKAKEKLEKWADDLSVLYIKTDDGDKFVYYPFNNAKKSIEENGKTVYAEMKDYIFISDFPFTYTYDNIYNQCNGIADENIKKEVLNAFNNKKENTYYYIYPDDRKVSLKSLNKVEAALINSCLIDKELIFTLGAEFGNKNYYYYFFYIKKNGGDALYIYKEATMDSMDNKLIYPSKMTKDDFINHLKVL